jgi:hypothetical protein
MIYHLIENEVKIHAAGQFLIFVLFPIGILALLSQLGGITVIIGAVLFAAEYRKIPSSGQDKDYSQLLYREQQRVNI